MNQLYDPENPAKLMLEKRWMAMFSATAWFRSGVYAIDTGRRRCAKSLKDIQTSMKKSNFES